MSTSIPTTKEVKVSAPGVLAVEVEYIDVDGEFRYFSESFRIEAPITAEENVGQSWDFSLFSYLHEYTARLLYKEMDASKYWVDEDGFWAVDLDALIVEDARTEYGFMSAGEVVWFATEEDLEAVKSGSPDVSLVERLVSTTYLTRVGA